MFRYKQGDTYPPLRQTLTRSSGIPVELNASSVKFTMINENNRLVITDNANIIDAQRGIVEYQWKETDLSRHGAYFAEFEVTYSNGKVETFPNTGYIKIKVVPDLDYRVPIDANTRTAVGLRVALQAANTAVTASQSVLQNITLVQQLANDILNNTTVTQTAVVDANAAKIQAQSYANAAFSSATQAQTLIGQITQALNTAQSAAADAIAAKNELLAILENPESLVGLSAYDLAVREGYTGTVTQWLNSLVGPAGANGPAGSQGPTGPQGPQGAAGIPGLTVVLVASEAAIPVPPAPNTLYLVPLV